MKPFRLIAALAVAGMLWPPILPAKTPSVSTAWEEARTAYDEGRWSDAAKAYQDILRQGQYAQELFFNLGNSWFKQNKLGLAVLNYRRAAYLEPRDPDTIANLQFALKQAKAEPPVLPFMDRFLRRASLSEWISIQLLCYWSVAAALGMAICWPQRRGVLLRLAVLLAFPLTLSLVAIAHWTGLRQHPEVVILEPGQQALYAPMESATASYPLPEGAVARKLDESGGWWKVSNGRQEGWIKASAGAAVYPWRGPELDAR